MDPLVFRVGQFFLEGYEAGPNRWAQIEKVARALIERRTLTYEQFCNLLVPPVPQAVIEVMA